MKASYTINFNIENMLEKCVRFGYTGTTDAELIAFFNSFFMYPHFITFAGGQIKYLEDGRPDIAFQIVEE